MMKQKIKKQSSVSVLMLLLMLVLTSLSVTNLNAQNKINGIVKDLQGMPIPGVNVKQSGTPNVVVTDINGNYSIQLKPGKKSLEFTSIGFVMQVVIVGSNSTINVILKDATQELDEVVIGYTAVKREKILGAVTGVKSESIEQATPVSALEAVQGRVAGVQILNNGGPGEGFDIRVRGTSTFGGAGTTPLYVVDGQQLADIDNLNPNDIESLEVIKDGATAAIYGAQAANGVVLITTKKGKPGDLKVDFSHTSGYNQLVGDIRVSNSRQRVEYDLLKAPSGVGSNSIERDTLSLLRTNSWDLQKLVTRPAIRNVTNFTVRGGNDKSKFYWGTGYTDEEGIVVNSDYKRLTSMLKLDLNVAKKFTLGSKINITYEEQNGLNEDQVFQQLVERIPYYAIYEPDGSYAPEFGGRANPLAETTATQRTRNYRAQLFNYAELEILPKLKIKSTLGINYRLSKFNNFNPVITVNPAVPIPTGRESYNMSYDIQQENFLNYKNSWGDHDFTAFGGMQIQKYAIEIFDIGAEFSNDYIQTFNNVDPLKITIRPATENRAHALYSLFTGFNYDFKNKYFLSGTLRRDGSSRFGANNKYGNFPSLSLGWKINKEKFFKVKQINNLMLRASYGVVGNEKISDYEFAGTLSTGSIYNGSGGIAPTRLGNDELKWEETASTNLGLDLGMFRNRLTLNVDFWKKVTTGLLALVPLPEESGFSSIRKNVGSVDNKGIDVTIGGTILKKKKFSWNSSFNISYQENKVTELDGGTPFDSGNYRIEEGQPIGNIFGYKNLGVYQYDQSNAYSVDGVQLTPNFDTAGTFVNYTLNGAAYTGTVNQMKFGNTILKGGDIIWEDIDANFNITDADRKIIGNGLPKYFGGFSNDFKFKNFTFGFLFDYSLGQDLYRRWDEARNDLNSNGETPGPDRIDGAWRKQGDVTVYPRLSRQLGVAQNGLAANSFFVTKGDYIKLRFIKFNYDIPVKTFGHLKGINAISLNLAVNNVLTWTNYIGFNPELGSRGNPLQPGLDGLRYPNDREIILGVKVQL